MGFAKGRRTYKAMIEDTIIEYKNTLSTILSLLERDQKEQELEINELATETGDGDLEVYLSTRSILMDSYILNYSFISDNLSSINI